MRVAIYTRISTDEVHQPYSLEAQDLRLRAYASSQEDWHLVRTFTDQTSGATLERPGLRSALAAAKAGHFDLLLVYRVDRFSRSVRGLAQLLEDLDQAGVAFRSATEPFDTTTAAGRMMVQMLGVFAEFERATIVDRVIAGMERKAARGEWCGGTRPYGYEIGDNGFLVVKEDESPLIPMIFDLYAQQRLGAKAIANQLNKSGHRTRNGRLWSAMAILTILRNRAYIGEVFFRDEYHQAPHHQLIDPEVFTAAQEVLEVRGDAHTKRASNSSDYLLSGLVVCTLCKKHFVGTAAHGKLYRYRYYTCQERARHGTVGCIADRVHADGLDQSVIQALLAACDRGDVIEQAVLDARRRSQAHQKQHEDERGVVEAELRQTEEAMERYLLAFESGSLPEAECGARLRTLGGKAAELRARRLAIAALIENAAIVAPTDEQLAALRGRVREAIGSGTPSVLKALLQALVHEVRVTSRDEVVPIFRLPIENPDGGAGVRTMTGVVPARRVELRSPP